MLHSFSHAPVKRQSGNVLFYILIVVALFAALSFVVSTMMRGQGASIGQERAQIMASEIIGYTNDLRQVTQMLRVSNGCAEEALSFELPPFDGTDETYVNGTAPSDFSCHIFHPAGGALGVRTPPMDVSDADYEYRVLRLDGIGSDEGGDLHVLLPRVRKSLCEAVNALSHVNDMQDHAAPRVVGESVFEGDFYAGDYEAAKAYIFDADNTARGAQVACVSFEKDPDIYHIYGVILPR